MAKRRPSGDGMVRKRKDGRWEGRIVVGHKENGHPIFRSVFAPTQKELLAKLHHNIEVYRGAELNEGCRMTLSDWLDRWLNDYAAASVRTSTLKGYRRYVELIKPYIGKKEIAKVTQSDVQRTYNHLKQNGRMRTDPKMGHQLSDSTVRSIHGVLFSAMKTAEEEHIVVHNPTIGVTVPKQNHAQKKILNDTQLARFMAELEKDPFWHDFFYTAITTGLRRGEICGLRWQDFDADAGTLQIRRTLHVHEGGRFTVGETKTGAGKRTITLPPSTALLLTEKKKKSYSEWIFHNQLAPEQPIRPTSAYRHLKKILHAADLPPIRFHDLRHTFATHALTSGVDAKTLSGILGHAKASFTLDTYTHVTGDMQKQAAGIVGSFMTDILGEELKPWQNNENAGRAE